jgi:hypothetical protein
LREIDDEKFAEAEAETLGSATLTAVTVTLAPGTDTGAV